MKTKTLVAVSAAVFTLVAIFHFLRAINTTPVMIANVSIPVWVSWAAVVFAGYLAHAAWTAK